MITISKTFEFDYGHRVLGHEGKCKNLHGHRGKAEIVVTAPDLDSIGRVIDFGEIKRLVGGWIDTRWDHQLLLHPEDPQLKHLQETESSRPYKMMYGNPTAENMAKELHFIASQLLLIPLYVVSVRLWETPTSSAEYKPD